MFCINQFGKCRKYIIPFYTKNAKLFSIYRSPSDFRQNVAKNIFSIQRLASSLIEINRHFKTCCPILNEETAVVETNKDETKPAVDPSKDRTKIVPPEVSISYMKSEAYKAAYGDDPVWVRYRRNFKGQWVPKKSRVTCIRGGVISTGNPCPICRDEYLVLDYTNVDLLKQFISPHTGEILSTTKTHICQKRLFQLEVAIKKARFYGLLTYEVPFRSYDYSDYYPKLKE